MSPTEQAASMLGAPVRRIGMSVLDWVATPARRAEAKRPVSALDGSFAPVGSVGDVCGYMPGETTAGGFVIVDFPETGAVLCHPYEITPA